MAVHVGIGDLNQNLRLYLEGANSRDSQIEYELGLDVEHVHITTPFGSAPLGCSIESIVSPSSLFPARLYPSICFLSSDACKFSWAADTAPRCEYIKRTR